MELDVFTQFPPAQLIAVVRGDSSLLSILAPHDTLFCTLIIVVAK